MTQQEMAVGRRREGTSASHPLLRVCHDMCACAGTQALCMHMHTQAQVCTHSHIHMHICICKKYQQTDMILSDK